MTSNDRLLREIRRSVVVVLHPPDEDRDILSLQLRRIGCEVREAWRPHRAPLEDASALFFFADPDRRSDFAWLCEWRRSALIAVIAYENPLVLQSIADIGVHGVVTKPIRPFGILASLSTALSTFKYQARLGARIEKLDETLRTRRFVERATRVLAKHRGISEDDAYALVRSEAMRKQVTLFEMANAIINADTIFRSGGN